MGLATSQARFLFLTARQSDVEYGLMRVLHDKLALARESSEAAEEYADTRNNAKKYTWETNNGSVDLTYDLLMRPNTIEDSGGQYILTNAASGRVILDSGYTGILGIAPSGNPGDIANLTYTVDGKTYTGEKAFLMKLMSCNSNTADSLIKQGNTTVGYNVIYDETKILNYALGPDVYTNANMLHQCYGSAEDVTSEFSEWLYQYYENELTPALINSLLDEPSNQFLGILQKAADYAIEATYAKFVYNINDKDSTNGVNVPPEATPNFHYGSCYYGLNRINSNGSGTATIDNVQLVNTFLNYFDQYCVQRLGMGKIGGTVGSNSSTRTGSDVKISVVTADIEPGDSDENSNNIDDAYEGSFYVNLYNSLLNFGWETNSDINDTQYLNNQIMYGNITIKNFKFDNKNQENWKNTSTSSYDCPLNLENDEEALVIAKAEYEVKKEQINVKEAALDINKNQLETEHAFIVTEKESVQKQINENIENSKMYDA